MRTAGLLAFLVACGGAPSAPGVDATGGNDDGDGADDATGPHAADGGPDATSWTSVAGGTAYERADSIAVLSSGDIVFAGYTTGVIDLGGGPLGLGGQALSLVLARYTAAGKHVWSRGVAIGNDQDPEPRARLAVNAADDIFVATTVTRASVDAGTGSLARVGNADLLLLKVSSTGTTTGARRLGGTDASLTAGDIALDGQGNLVVTGTFDTTFPPMAAKTIDLGNGAITGHGMTDAWAAGFDHDLATRWSRKLGEPPATVGVSGAAIAIDPTSNDAVVCGGFRGTVDFGGGARTAAGNSQNDIFLVTVDGAGGDYVADTILGGTGIETCHDLVVDSSGGKLVTGRFTGTTSMGGMTASSPSGGLGTAFVVRIAGSTATYLTTFGAQNGAAAVLSITRGGLIGGSFTGTVSIGQTPLISAASSSAGFVARISSTGGVSAAAKTVESGNGPVRAVAETASAAFAAGGFDGQVLVDGAPVASTGSYDLYVARLAL